MTDILTDMVLVESEKTATIHAPVERVDIADWLLHLPDAEYQRCAPPDHIAAGSTTTDDGRPMSINVEVIGGTLMVQHYVAEAHEPHHRRMVSLSDVQTPAGWTKIGNLGPERHRTGLSQLPIHQPGAQLPDTGIPGDARGRRDLVRRRRGRPPSRQ
jgi:hypothetical protein